MKKLLGISVVAMLAVSPMMANADPVPATLAEPTTATAQAPAANTDHAPKYAPANIQAADASHIASTAYVKGAYNAAIAAVNKVYDTATGAAETALTSAGGNGLAWNDNSKKLDVDLAGESGLTMGTGDDAGKLMVNAGDGLAINATSGALEAKLNGTTLENSADGLKVKAGGITSTELASNSVTTAAITDGNVTFAKVDATDIIDSSETLGIYGDGTNSTASDSKFVTAKAVAKAVEAAKTAVTVSEGAGIDVTNNKISVDLTSNGGLKMSDNTDAATLEIDTGNGLVIDTTGDDAGKLKVKTKASNSGLTLDSNGLYVAVDGSTVEIDSTNGVQVKDSGITSAKLATDSVTTAKIENGAVTAAKLASGIIQNSIRATSTATTDTSYAGNATVASEQAVATEVANLKTGVAATINAATVKLYTTWGDDTSTGEGSTAAGTIVSSGYTQGS